MDMDATKENRHNLRKEKVVKSDIKLGIPFIVPDLVNKFERSCFRETYVIEWKSKVGWTVKWTWVKLVCLATWK